MLLYVVLLFIVCLEYKVTLSLGMKIIEVVDIFLKVLKAPFHPMYTMC